MRTSTSPASGPSEVGLRGGSFEGAPQGGLRPAAEEAEHVPSSSKATTTKSYGHEVSTRQTTLCRTVRSSEEPVIGRASHRKPSYGLQSSSSGGLIRRKSRQGGGRREVGIGFWPGYEDLWGGSLFEIHHCTSAASHEGKSTHQFRCQMTLSF